MKNKQNFSSPKEMLNVKWILAGAVLGGATGGVVGSIAHLKGMKKSRKVDKDVSVQDSKKPDEPEGETKGNLKHAPDADDALLGLSDYRSLSPSAFDSIRDNLDRMVGVYLLLHGKQTVSPSLEMKAYRYRTNITESLKVLLKKYEGVNAAFPKRLQEDIDQLLKVTDTYLFNISQQMRQKFASHQVSSSLK
jgi:hypothetical protein